MSQTIQVIGLLFELIAFLVGLTMGYLVYKKNPDYIGNKLMALASVLIASYPGATLFYDSFPTYTTIQVGMRLGMICIMLGSVFLYFSIQIIVHSSSWWDKKSTWIFPLIIAGFISIYLIFTDYIEIVDIGTTVNNRIDIVPLGVVILFVLACIVYSMYDLYKTGIKKSEGEEEHEALPDEESGSKKLPQITYQGSLSIGCEACDYPYAGYPGTGCQIPHEFSCNRIRKLGVAPEG